MVMTIYSDEFTGCCNLLCVVVGEEGEKRRREGSGSSCDKYEEGENVETQASSLATLPCWR